MQYIKSDVFRKSDNVGSLPAWRKSVAFCVTVFDADKFPIITKHWPGLLIVNGNLACHDNSPIINHRQMDTVHE